MSMGTVGRGKVDQPRQKKQQVQRPGGHLLHLRTVEFSEVGMCQGGRGAARSQIGWASWTMVRTVDLLPSETEPLQDFELRSDKN